MNRATILCGLGALLLAATGCGERAPVVIVREAVLDTLYAEPPTSTDPLLIMPRDVLWHGGRLYVLDGRTSRVGFFDPDTGEVLGTFGGWGEGPGELGAFPHTLAGDGDRIGVGHMGSVSWFTLTGGFRSRDRLPAYDLATPSLLRLEDGWLANIGYRGPGAPVALLTADDGDTTGFGRTVAPPVGDESALAANELNTVHVGRFPDGGVLLAWVQYPWVDLYGGDGTLRRRIEDTELPADLERRPNGLLLGVPGYTLSTATGVDGRVYVVDGTFQNIRVFDADGSERMRYRIPGEVVMRVTAGPDGDLWAIGIEDAVYRVRVLTVEPGGAGPGENIPGRRPEQGGKAGEEESASTLGMMAEESFPGRLEIVVEDLRYLLEDHGVWRSTVRRDQPALELVHAGERTLFLGYGDGQGVRLLEDLERGGGWRVGSTLGAHPERTVRSRTVMAGDALFILDVMTGLFALDRSARAFHWPADWFVRAAVWLEGDRWLVHDATMDASEPLHLVDLAAGTSLPAGGQGRHRTVRTRWPMAVNDWHLGRWGEGRVLVFDESAVRLAFWDGSEGLGPWVPVSGSGLRSFEQRDRGRNLENDLKGALTVPGQGLLLLREEDLGDYNYRNHLLAVRPDGRVAARWVLPTSRSIRGFTRLPDGRIFLNTSRLVLEWTAAASAVEGALAPGR